MTGYWIYYISAGGGDSGSAGSITGTSHTLDNFQDGMTYTIAVIAVGDHLPSEAVVTQSRAPSPPSITNSAVSPTYITIFWTQPLARDVVLRYRIEYQYQGACVEGGFDGSMAVDAPATEYTLDSLQEHSNYTITLTAENNLGNGASAPATFATLSSGN